MFINIDKQLKKMGFNKVAEGEIIVSYERYNEVFRYTQTVDIIHKYSGKHILQSFAEDDKMVGLTYREMKLFLKKMKQLGWTN